MEDQRKGLAWWVLDGVGQEPFIHDLQVFLHLAGCKTGTDLSDHKGYTNGDLDGWVRLVVSGS